MAAVDALKSERAILKRKLTIFEKFMDGLPNDPKALTEKQSIELRKRHETIKKLMDSFDTIQLQIELASEQLEAEYLEREAFDARYYSIDAEAQVLMGENNSKKPDNSNNSLVSDANQNSCIRLPALEIPKFSGVQQSWIEFRDTFESLINKNGALPNIQKFHYLKASLVGKAAELLKTQAFSAENYDSAWDIICKRYNDKRGLIRNHLNALFSVDNPSKDSAVKFRKIIDNTRQHVKFLNTLVPEAKLGEVIIIHHLTSYLDTITKRDCEEIKNIDNPPTIDEFLEFLELKASEAEAIEGDAGKFVVSRDHSKMQIKPNIKQNIGTRAFLVSNSNNLICHYCKESHLIFNCQRFLSLPVNDRIDYAKRNQLCSNCFFKGHFAKDCKSRFSCRECKGRHHSILHLAENRFLQPPSPVAGQNSANRSDMAVPNRTLSSFIYTHSSVLLSTALVNIADKQGELHIARVLLDSGSQSNYITLDLFKRLNLTEKPTHIKVMGVMDSATFVHSQCDVSLYAKRTQYNLNFSCLIVPLITGALPNVEVNTAHLSIPANITLADPTFMKPGPVDILLGAGHFYDLLCVGQISLGPGQPKLQKTRFGWVISGPICRVPSVQNETRCHFSATIENQLSKFWEIEEIPHIKPLSPEESECEHHFIENTTREPNGRFVVKLPLKNSPCLLGDSYHRAKKSFFSLERRFSQNPDLRNKYAVFMRDYLDLGHMSPSPVNVSQSAYYLPHHCVVKEDSVSTKLRVVFNGSAPSTSGQSVNALQMVGPTIQRDLFSILVSFRSFTYVIAADIEKMYRQVLVCPSQRSLQRILWRENPKSELQSYDLNTITYGTAAASFLAIRCLFQLGIDCLDTDPIISNIICNHFYVDDLLTGCDNLEQAQSICENLPKVLASGCFRLCKWMSNDPRILNNIASSEMHPNFINFGENECTKTLGLSWQADTDNLTFTIPDLLSTKITKRSILSETAQIFDPLGLVSPCTVIPKLILQQLWLQKLDWDESIPLDINQKWLQCRSSLKALRNLKIPRHAICRDYASIQIHGFADASSEAYGCAVYIRSTNATGEIFSNLLCSKTKVAPLKTLTIPRLELCGALLLARLVSNVLKSLRLRFDSCHLWTDSTIVLGWINTAPHLLKTFVSHRISEIQTMTANATWSHVPTAENPADLLSRGLLPKQIENCTLWWNGPRFLLSHESTWPNSPQIENNLPELKISVTTFLVSTEDFTFPFNRFSCLTRLENLAAYCLRFVHNVSTAKNMRITSDLTVNEIDNARTWLIKLTQSESFPSELKNLQQGKQISTKSKILSLSPFLDDKGVIRVGGRLQNSDYNFEKIHPILLDGSHTFTKLLAEREHDKLLHAGPQLLLSQIREKYWPTRGKDLTKRVVRSCLPCFRALPKGIQPILGSLPKERVSQSFPFDVVATDYAGPFNIKDRKGRGAKTSKCYICLFVCLATKAIHIELVSDLSTDAFLAALRRFAARKGKPSKIFSDNGTNFVGANSKLRELGTFLKSNNALLAQLATAQDINWHFNPPYAPHMNGLCEAGVKSVKHHLKRVAGNALLTFEEMTTLLTQIESILNSRALTPLSCDPNDLAPLTPAHFLIGRPMLSVADSDKTAIPASRLSQFERIQQILQHFWSRWQREYISEMQRRLKWSTNLGTLEPNQLVLIKEDGLPPLRWRLGRVLEVHPGQDGVARVATIKTSQGTIRRAAPRLCPLPTENSEGVRA